MPRVSASAIRPCSSPAAQDLTLAHTGLVLSMIPKSADPRSPDLKNESFDITLSCWKGSQFGGPRDQICSNERTLHEFLYVLLGAGTGGLLGEASQSRGSDSKRCELGT